MNKTIEIFTRNEIKTQIHKLNDDCHTLFKRMYSNDGLSVPIDIVIDQMPVEKLDWALSQIQNSFKNPKLLRLDTSGKCLC